MAHPRPFSRARGFVSWAVRGGHARSIEIPRFKNELTREVFSDHDRRSDLARRLLTEDTVALTNRVAALLVLLYAQRVTKITRLTTSQVSTPTTALRFFSVANRLPFLRRSAISSLI